MRAGQTFMFLLKPRSAFVLLGVAIVGLLACQRPNGFTAEIFTTTQIPGAPKLSGKLYLRGKHLRLDWGQFADIFDVQQRKGWRIIDGAHAYQELNSKDLSTYAPEMVNGSLCSHAQVPSACKLLSMEKIGGRAVKKWDVYNPKGFHVYYWTDEALGITLRMDLGDAATYEVKNLTEHSVPDSMFAFPVGYTRMDKWF